MRKMLVCLLALILLQAPEARAQWKDSPYRLRWEMEVPIAFNAAALLGGSLYAGSRFKMPSEATVLALDPNTINRFDRSATRQNSHAAAIISDAGMYMAMALPAFHLINKNSRKDFGTVAAMGAEVFLLNLGVTNLVKELVGRPRPLLYNPEIPMSRKMKKDNFKSYFSGHTSTAASMSFYFAMTYHHYHPGNKLRPLVWTGCAILPALTGFMRYKAGKHYWTDILTGYAVGALIGVGVPMLHRKVLSINR